MAFRAAFIGINKYIEARIRDLIGAQRDATALWALFTDTMTEIDARLIIDNDATVDRIRKVLDDLLGGASSDDTVIISFSGHGTRDHRLVAHNTAVDALVNTTISLDELAAKFKESRAKIILCILDCCFSGGAPARVLEDSPLPRDIDGKLETLVGPGRFLLAASNVDEPAYELPGQGHGILTKAILQVLQAGDKFISLPTAIDEIMECVRVEAGRIGFTQTPVLLGYVEGGLVLPVLRPGKNFFSAFPEKKGARVSSMLADLAVFGIPEPVLTEWADRLRGGLNNLQVAAVNEHRILDGNSLLVIAPTSAGKTFIGEMAATRAIIEGRKAIFLLPYRALVNEKFDQFSELYGSRLGMRVVRCTGDYIDQTESFIRGKYDLACLTYEMFLNLTLSNPALLVQIGLIVLDEGQFLTDPFRGITVELLLTNLRTIRERGVTPQLIVLSAVIGNVNNFDDWLEIGRLVTTERPVKLLEGVLDRNGTYQFIEPDGKEQRIQLLPPGSIQIRKDKPGAQDVIVPLAQLLVPKGEKIIIFRNQRGPAEGCANYLANELGLPGAEEVIATLPVHDLSTTSASLRRALSGGTAFHNSNLGREERLAVERAFRDPAGKVRVLAATTTVAAGINTPASTVILAEQEFIGEDGRPFTVAEYKNMAGRAGRLGFREDGKSIILADTSYDRDRLFRKYVIGSLEPLRSSFDPNRLETWIIRLLAQVDRIPKQDAVRLLANTYGGYLAAKVNPKWQVETKMQLGELLARMISIDLVEEENDYIRLTLLGRACGRSALSFESAMRLVELLRSTGASHLTPEKLMALLQVLEESDGGYTPMMKRGRSEAKRPGQATERFGTEVVIALQRYARDEFDYYARCKRASLLWDWINGMPVEKSYIRRIPFRAKLVWVILENLRTPRDFIFDLVNKSRMLCFRQTHRMKKQLICYLSN
jgi:helicase